MNASIIIPAHNEEQYLAGLLNSINIYMGEDVEIVVVDNGSTDNTAKLAEDCRCTLISSSKKLFPSTARNLGVYKAEGDCLIFLDADVVITKEWVSAYMELERSIDDMPEKFIAGFTYYMSHEPGWLEKYWFEPLSRKKKTYINGGNLITNRATYDSVDGFNEALETGEDVDFCKRAVGDGAELIFNDRWKVHHEGFPKTIKDYVKRESWHGVGDLVNIHEFLKSKIAIGALIFTLLHVTLFLAAVNTFFEEGNRQISYFIILMAVVSIIAICYVRASVDIPMRGLRAKITTTFISYLYLLGRSLSFHVLFKK